HSEVVSLCFNYGSKLRGSTRSIHTAGVFVTGCRVAKVFLRHEVFLSGGWLGDTLHWRLS
ncbi:hypothetical protein, partial [Desulfosporosinus metallidurans]|uniref:hypothetical protein n=1 Tax=Desulfosporosinus metallidurans TaxID=1888891 RepID=UPI001A9A364C